MLKLSRVGKLFWKIRGVLVEEFFREKRKHENKSARYLIHLDSRQYKEVVIVTKEWNKKGKLYSTQIYFHVKENWSVPNIILQINLMPGPGGMS